MPRTADGTLHLYRLVALDHAMRQGDLWPRYVPGLAYGYGAPFFNYYSPLSLYPLEFLHLPGVSFRDAWLLGMVFYAVIGTAGAYLLGRIWGGEITGIAAAVAYTYAPYTLYDAVWRGTVSESAALALLPWAFWGFTRLALSGQRRHLLAAVVCYALFILMHNVITLHSTALLLVYGAYLAWSSPARRRTAGRLLLAFALALGVTAFFWIPALLETGYVKINEITANLPDIDVVRNLGTLDSLVAPPLTADPTQLQPSVPIALGWPQIILGTAALVLVTWRSRGRNQDARLRGWVWLAALLLAGLIYMTIEASGWLWKIAPLIRYSQFPWRLVGPASLLLAALAGVGTALIARRIRSSRGRMIWFGACLLVMMAYAMPWLYGSTISDPPAENILDAQNFERETGWIATSSFGEYLPRWTQETPDAEKLIARYAESEVIPRLEPPTGVNIRQAEWGMTYTRLTLQAETHTTLEFDWLYVPGWWARLDGADLAVSPSEPHGLVRVEIPAGDHTLEVGLGLTPTQAIATLISLGAVVLLIGIPFAGMGHPSPPVELKPQPENIPRLFVYAAVLGAAVFAGKLMLVDPAQTPIKRERFANGVEAGLQTPVQANFNHHFVLLGYDLSDREIRSGAAAALALYWQLKGEPVTEDYSSILRLRDAKGNIISETGSFYPGGLATHNWLPGYYLQERLTVNIPPGTPPGAYTLDVGLFSPSTQRSLDVINAQGNPEDVKAVIGTVNVTRPESPATPNDLSIENRLDKTFGELTLIGLGKLPERAEVGQEFTLKWYWKAAQQPQTEIQARLAWLDENGQPAASTPNIMLTTGYPAREWQAGDVWRGIHRVYVPGKLDAGRYTVAVSHSGVIAEVGEMDVSAPPRAFDVPEMAFKADTDWQNGIRLSGYDLPQDIVLQGESLHLTLYWQPQQGLSTSLRIFVHVVSSNGQIATQQDQIPVNWTRPTTGWMAGEVLADTYSFVIGEDVPPGEYSIQIGWYDPVTSERINLAAGADFWTLPQKITVR